MLFEKNDTVLFIGDSISDYERARPVGEGLFNAWGRSYVACAGALLGCMYPELSLRVVNMGISGNQVRDLKNRWQSDVFDRKPDWVSVLIGINDVWRQFDTPQIPEHGVMPDEYRATLSELVHQTKPLVKGLVLITPVYWELNKQDAMAARVAEYQAICREIAEAEGVLFCDAQAYADRVLKCCSPNYITWDRVHPNIPGANVLAHALLDTLEFDWNRK